MGLRERVGAALSAVRNGAFGIFGSKPNPAPTRPSSVVVQQWQPLVVTNWTIENVLGAINQHELGQFQQSALLAASFGRDDRITACRNTRIRALVGRNGVGFKVEPSKEGDQRRAGVVASDTDKHWAHAHPEGVLFKILQDGIDLGVSISRIHQERTKRGAYKSEWVPRLEPWDMQHAYWSENDLAYVVNTRDGVMRADRGTGEWFVYEPAGQFGWMAGAVRCQGLPFMFRSFNTKDWARFCEKHGVPILAIIEPAEEADPFDKAKKAFYARLRKMGREGIIRLPQDKSNRGFDAKFIEPRDTAWQTFEAFSKRLDISTAIYYLGQNLSTESTGGGLNGANKAQDNVRLDYLAADAEALSTQLRNDVWMPWGRFNFDWWDDEIAPWPTWNTAPPENLESRAAMVDKFASALERMRRANFFVDERKLADQFQVPMLTDLEIEKLKKERAEAAALLPKPQAIPGKGPKKDDETAS